MATWGSRGFAQRGQYWYYLCVCACVHVSPHTLFPSLLPPHLSLLSSIASLSHAPSLLTDGASYSVISPFLLYRQAYPLPITRKSPSSKKRIKASKQDRGDRALGKQKGLDRFNSAFTSCWQEKIFEVIHFTSMISYTSTKKQSLLLFLYFPNKKTYMLNMFFFQLASHEILIYLERGMLLLRIPYQWLLLMYTKVSNIHF